MAGHGPLITAPIRCLGATGSTATSQAAAEPEPIGTVCGPWPLPLGRKRRRERRIANLNMGEVVAKMQFEDNRRYRVSVGVAYENV